MPTTDPETLACVLARREHEAELARLDLELAIRERHSWGRLRVLAAWLGLKEACVGVVHADLVKALTR